MDDKDRQIVAALQADGRISNQDLADRVNLSPSPCLRRVRALEEAGVIRGYTAVVDEEACGFPIMAFVRIRLERHEGKAVAAFEDAIRGVDEVLDCYVVTGDADFLLRVVVESLKHYERLVRTRLHRIPGITSIDTSFTYGQIKRAGALPFDVQRPQGSRV